MIDPLVHKGVYKINPNVYMEEYKVYKLHETRS
jgi:hypothetical protein